MKAKLKQWIRGLVLRSYPNVYHRRVARHDKTIFREQFFPFRAKIHERLFGEKDEACVLAGLLAKPL